MAWNCGLCTFRNDGGEDEDACAVCASPKQVGPDAHVEAQWLETAIKESLTDGGGGGGGGAGGKKRPRPGGGETIDLLSDGSSDDGDDSGGKRKRLDGPGGFGTDDEEPAAGPRAEPPPPPPLAENGRARAERWCEGHPPVQHSP